MTRAGHVGQAAAEPSVARMRRRTTGAAVLVTLLALLAGCGGDEAEESGPAESSSTSPATPEVPAASLTQVELVPEAFPLAEIPTVDGKVVSALDTSVAINAALDREAAFAEAVTRMEAAGYVAERMEEADAEATFTGRGLTVRLLVVADGPSNAGVSYSVD